MSSARASILVVALIMIAFVSGLYFSCGFSRDLVTKSSEVPPVNRSDIPAASPESHRFTPDSAVSLASHSQARSAQESSPSYHYNAQGQLQLIRYPDGSTYTYVYDDHGDKISETTRTGLTWTYLYDVHQNPVRVIDPEGCSVDSSAPGQP